MHICIAPLEGSTDAVFRKVHYECFRGADRYYIPFISPNQNRTFSARELNAVAPEYNNGVPAIPQILAKDPELFLWCAEQLAGMGYPEVNLNLGCPACTVTAKRKGSGLLREKDLLLRLLDGIYGHSPLPVSIKTRIGYDSAEEWPELMEIYNRYPVQELIVHPRTRSLFYSGEVDMAAFEEAVSIAKMPLMYNGDLFSVADCQRITKLYPGLSGIMLGRGVLTDPSLVQRLVTGETLTKDALKHFHDRLMAAYLERWQEGIVLGRMREIMKRTAACFGGYEKPLKHIRKARTLAEYLTAANELFLYHPLLPEEERIPCPY